MSASTRPPVNTLHREDSGGTFAVPTASCSSCLQPTGLQSPRQDDIQAHRHTFHRMREEDTGVCTKHTSAISPQAENSAPVLKAEAVSLRPRTSLRLLRFNPTEEVAVGNSGARSYPVFLAILHRTLANSGSLTLPGFIVVSHRSRAYLETIPAAC